MTNNFRVDRPVIHVLPAVEYQPEEKLVASISNNSDGKPSVRVEISSSSYLESAGDNGGHQGQPYRRQPHQLQRPTISPLKFQTGAVLSQLMETMGGTGTQTQRSGTYLDTFV